ncbi:branched-chain amino acid aminotransferase [Tissierella creatinini]|nr:branched-chain amino acid aminotransferase [Tissierella creatinini]TJX62489.1 branched-chain amino acid aminotransferase [Soehngenia saccharolytica]
MRSEVIKDFYVVNGDLISSNDLTLFEGISKPPIYEIIRIIDGVPIYLEDHLNRMYESAKLTGIDLISEGYIKSYIKDIILKNKLEKGNIKLLSGESDGKNFFSVFCVESFYPPKEYYENGIKTILYKHERNNPNAKVLHTSFKEDVAKAIKESGAFEALLVRNDGYIPEGSRSNIFFVKGEKMYTAPKEEVLLGITRKHLFKIAEKLGITIIEESIHVDDLKKIEGAFMTGTSVNILPISEIDDIKLNSVNNKIIKTLNQAYDNMIIEYIEKNKEIWK